jgi:hypothetical protein
MDNKEAQAIWLLFQKEREEVESSSQKMPNKICNLHIITKDFRNQNQMNNSTLRKIEKNIKLKRIYYL